MLFLRDFFTWRQFKAKAVEVVTAMEVKRAVSDAEASEAYNTILALSKQLEHSRYENFAKPFFTIEKIRGRCYYKKLNKRQLTALRERLGVVSTRAEAFSKVSENRPSLHEMRKAKNKIAELEKIIAEQKEQIGELKHSLKTAQNAPKNIEKPFTKHQHRVRQENAPKYKQNMKKPYRGGTWKKNSAF